MLIALDFDGTVVENGEFPEMGVDNGALPWVNLGRALGVEYILNTCRTGEELLLARMWLDGNGYAPVLDQDQVANKVRAQLYIDDKALSAPLTIGSNGRDCVDWNRAGPLMLEAILARKRRKGELPPPMFVPTALCPMFNPRQVTVWHIVGDWAVTSAVDPSPLQGAYTATHVPTGKAMPRTAGITLPHALRIAMGAAKIVPGPNSTASDVIRNAGELEPMIARVLGSAGGPR